MLAVPLAAQAADYRAQLVRELQQRPRCSPPLDHAARTSSTTAAGGVPAATGVVRFNVDTRHLTSSAWASMLAARPGTQLGTFSSNLTGTSSLRVLSHGKDTAG